jgi:hypothetical protein
MRCGEISKLEWPMLDQSSQPWVLRIPGSITKNGKAVFRPRRAWETGGRLQGGDSTAR